MDLEAVEVADDEQRRIEEVFAVVEELFVGFFEVLVLAFVLPGEVAAHPDVGVALASAGFGDVFFEGVTFALGVGFGGLRLAEHLAEIEEVRLGAAALGLRVDLPAVDEVGYG